MSMTQAALDQWIADHGFQERRRAGTARVPNPEFDEYDTSKIGQKPYIDVPKYTWIGEDGAKITIYDNPDKTEGAPEFETEGSADAKQPAANAKSEQVRAEEEAQAGIKTRTDQEAERERAYNANPANPRASGYYETHAQAEARRLDVAKRGSELQQQQDTRQAAQDRLELERASGVRADRGLVLQEASAKRADAAAERAAKAQEASTALAQSKYENIDLPQFELTKSNRAEDVAFRTKDFDYKVKQDEAKAMRDDFAIKIQLHQMSAQDAANQYNRWYQSNVEIPMKQIDQQRQSAEAKMRWQQAQDAQQQFDASFRNQRASTALTAGQHAAQNEIALLPYRVGPTFSGEMADAINAVAKSDTSGIHFTPGSFMFKEPNLQKISDKATGKAIKLVGNYNPRNIDQPDIPTFQMPDMNTAPQITPFSAQPPWWVNNEPTPSSPMTAPENPDENGG